VLHSPLVTNENTIFVFILNEYDIEIFYSSAIGF